MASGPLNVGMPSSPLVDPETGNIAPEWRAFLTSLWVRTGGSFGTTTDALQQGLAAEATARVAGDNALHGEITSEAAARTAGDAANTAAIEQEAAIRGAAVYNETVGRVQGDTAAAWASRSYASLPTTDPGGGLPWLSSGNIHVGP